MSLDSAEWGLMVILIIGLAVPFVIMFREMAKPPSNG